MSNSTSVEQGMEGDNEGLLCGDCLDLEGWRGEEVNLTCTLPDGHKGDQHECLTEMSVAPHDPVTVRWVHEKPTDG